jgi:hypothetical protein
MNVRSRIRPPRTALDYRFPLFPLVAKPRPLDYKNVRHMRNGLRVSDIVDERGEQQLITRLKIERLLVASALIGGLALLLNTRTPANPTHLNANPKAVVAPSLTGIWTSDDGGIYQIRQIGENVWWYGQSPDGGKAYTHVFHGVQYDDGEIAGSWVDVPPGRATNNGTMTILLVFEDGNYQIRKQRETGGFWSSVWKKIDAIPTPTPTPTPIPTTTSEPTSQFSVLPDGRVQKTEPDGTKRIYGDGSDTVIFPGQQPQTIMHIDAQPPTPPATLLGQGGLNNWLQKQNERVLGAIEGLLAPNERASSIANLKSKESGKSEFDQLNFSTRALSKMR